MEKLIEFAAALIFTGLAIWFPFLAFNMGDSILEMYKLPFILTVIFVEFGLVVSAKLFWWLLLH